MGEMSFAIKAINTLMASLKRAHQTMPDAGKIMSRKGYSHTCLDGMCRLTGCPFTVKIMRQGVLF